MGLTEEEARAAGRDIVVGRRDYAGNAHGLALVYETTFATLLVDATTGEIVGSHNIGPQAASLIQPLVQAMQFGQTAQQIANEPYWIHPAVTEVVENSLLEALEQL